MGAPERGRLIALEGGEASGKTTQAHLLAAALGAVITREPGGTTTGERIRTLVLGDAQTGSTGPEPRPLVPRAEALLMLAARAQHVAEVVDPALDAGRWVVTDRFAGSTLAYQGYGRGLDLLELRHLASWAAGGLWPDLSILLEVAAQVSAARRPAGRGRDRLESESRAFHERVAAGYRALAAAEPDRWAVVDGSGSPDAVGALVLEAVIARLGRERMVTCIRAENGADTRLG